MSLDTKPSGFAPIAQVGDPDAFRNEVRGWLAATLPAGWQDALTGCTEADYIAFQRWWFAELMKAGLATAHWPKAWGGEELPMRYAVILNQELARADAPRPLLFTISLFHLPATLFAFGTAEQQARYLTGVRDRGEIWCQGFSEPGAGSDLASLRTRAVRKVKDDGSVVYVVNGQKVWSSMGLHADYYLLLARTDPDAPKKQAGISFFLMDLNSPGVTRRPIRQINGEAEFIEVFLDDVEIPAENLVGQENEGWKIAQSTLAAERGLIIIDLAERMGYEFAAWLSAAKADRVGWWADHGLRREFMRLYARMVATRAKVRQMAREIVESPHAMGMATPTYVKLLFSELLHDYSAFMLARAGLAGQAWSPKAMGGGKHSANKFDDYLSSYSWTIAGGTNEVLKNVVAERLLGLPR